jgi:hypothetical protein
VLGDAPAVEDQDAIAAPPQAVRDDDARCAR